MEKLVYEAPETSVVVMTAEGMFCESGNGFNIVDFTEGETF